MRTTKQKKHDFFRAKENASKYHWDRMTKEEKDWLIAFEVSEYEAERGHMTEAVDALLSVGATPSEQYIQDLRGRQVSARNENPQRSDSKLKADRKYDNYQGIRAPKSSTYDSSDYVRVMPGKINKDDLGFEPAYSTSEITQTVDEESDRYENSKLETLHKVVKIEPGLNPDETAVMISPEDGMIEAIDAAKAKGNRSLEKLVIDCKLSKAAKEELALKTQAMVYAATTYSMHANLILDMNFVYKAPNGQLWVTDQHGRLQTLALYLKRRTSESIVTHAEVSYPGLLQKWTFQPGHRSDVEGRAVQV